MDLLWGLYWLWKFVEYVVVLPGIFLWMFLEFADYLCGKGEHNQVQGSRGTATSESTEEITDEEFNFSHDKNISIEVTAGGDLSPGLTAEMIGEIKTVINATIENKLNSFYTKQPPAQERKASGSDIDKTKGVPSLCKRCSHCQKEKTERDSKGQEKSENDKEQPKTEKDRKESISVHNYFDKLINVSGGSQVQVGDKNVINNETIGELDESLCTLCRCQMDSPSSDISYEFEGENSTEEVFQSQDGELCEEPPGTRDRSASWGMSLDVDDEEKRQLFFEAKVKIFKAAEEHRQKMSNFQRNKSVTKSLRKMMSRKKTH